MPRRRHALPNPGQDVAADLYHTCENPLILDAVTQSVKSLL